MKFRLVLFEFVRSFGGYLRDSTDYIADKNVQRTEKERGLDDA